MDRYKFVKTLISTIENGCIFLMIIFNSMLFKRFWRAKEVGRAVNKDNNVCFSTVVFDELPPLLVGVVEFEASICSGESGW